MILSGNVAFVGIVGGGVELSCGSECEDKDWRQWEAKEKAKNSRFAIISLE